ncbi:hypothetical protein FB451DRAFT_1564096 [Mycena latifolia]|nr:hypothetical protein FB451DRAFT_1564096 [Mycena latifolia]
MNSPSNSINEKRGDEKVQRDDVEVSVVDIDTAATLVSGDRSEFDAASEEALRIRRKIDYDILPLMCILYWTQYMGICSDSQPAA